MGPESPNPVSESLSRCLSNDHQWQPWQRAPRLPASLPPPHTGALGPPRGRVIQTESPSPYMGGTADHSPSMAQGSTSSVSKGAPSRAHLLCSLQFPHSPANVTLPQCLCMGCALCRETWFPSPVHYQLLLILQLSAQICTQRHSGTPPFS